MSREAPYDVILVGAGLANLLAAEQLARGGKRVLLLERGSLDPSVPVKDMLYPPASVVTPGRGGFGVGHYTDPETTKLIRDSLFKLFERDPDLSYLPNSAITDYVIRHDSVPKPADVLKAYEVFRDQYRERYNIAEKSVQSRMIHPDELFEIIERDKSTGKFPEALTGKNADYLDKHIAVVVRTLEGRLDMQAAYWRAVENVKKANVTIQTNFDVQSLGALDQEGQHTVTGRRLSGDGDPIVFIAPCVVVGAWYNTVKLIKTAYDVEDKFSYRIKMIIDTLILYDEVKSKGVESFFVGLNDKGCMLAIDKSGTVTRDGKQYYRAKMTSVVPTNIDLYQSSKEVEAALQDVRANTEDSERRAREIIRHVCEVSGLALEHIELEKCLHQVVVTEKVKMAPDQSVQEVVAAGMIDPHSAFNRRAGVKVFKVKDTGLVAAFNFKLVEAANTAHCITAKADAILHCKILKGPSPSAKTIGLVPATPPAPAKLLSDSVSPPVFPPPAFFASPNAAAGPAPRPGAASAPPWSQRLFCCPTPADGTPSHSLSRVPPSPS